MPAEEGKPPDGRKEFSVTFYDLDGHSKITQDDIAGLVRSIYAALNDSIAVPHGGKKTIKVHLTVTSSDKQHSDSEPEIPNNNNNNNNNQTNNNIPPRSRCKLRKNLNVTIQENLKHECGGSPQPRQSSYLPPSERPNNNKFDQIRTPNRLSFRGCRVRSPEIIQDCTASPLHHRKKWREQAAARRTAATAVTPAPAIIRPPNLCELLQANMEENNVNCCRGRHSNQHHHNHQHHHGHHQNNRCSHNQFVDPDCPVLPLYHCNGDHCSGRRPEQQQPARKCETPRCKKNQPQHNHVHHHHHHHHHQQQQQQLQQHQQQQQAPRSRSHDNQANSQNLFNYHLLSESDERLTTLTNLQKQQQELKEQQQFIDELFKNKCNLIGKEEEVEEVDETLELLLGFKSNVNHASFNHQLKHRNREQEHARAMAQVISWLERDIGIDKNCERKKPATAPTSEGVLPASTPTKVKKHEHHHVHHHYLHYAKETPIIV